MIKTAPLSTLSPQMWSIKNNKRLVCTHLDLLARICKLVESKKFGLISLNFIQLLRVELRGENDSKQSDEFQATV